MGATAHGVRTAPGLPDAPFTLCREDVGVLPSPFGFTPDKRIFTVRLYSCAILGACIMGLSGGNEASPPVAGRALPGAAREPS